MSNFVVFNGDQFSSLSTGEFAQQWENIKLESLWEEEQKIVSDFLTLAKGDSDIELNLNNVLLVKTNEGMLERVYGPSIFRESEDGDGLILKVGANSFPVEIKNERLVVGYLTGRFTWVPKERVDKTRYDLLTARLADSRVDDADEYEIGCSLVAKEATEEVNGKVQSNPLFLSLLKLDKLLQSNAALGQFFTAAKSGGGSVYKMQNLQANSEHTVVAVDVTEPHPEYGVSYILRLDGGASVFARGNSEVVLKKNLGAIRKQLAEGKTWTLKVGTIDEYTPGKFKVNNALVARQASLGTSTPKPIQQARPALSAAPTGSIEQPKGFSATSGNSEQGKQWAISQGLSAEQADALKTQIDTLAAERQEANKPLHVNERRQMFIDLVQQHLATNPTQTLDVAATPVSDEIPF